MSKTGDVHSPSLLREAFKTCQIENIAAAASSLIDAMVPCSLQTATTTATSLPHAFRSSSNGQQLSRRGALLLGGVAQLLITAQSAGAAQGPTFACPGERGYALQQCLRKARQERAEAEGSTADDDVQGERLKFRQYEQPGEKVTLPSGIQYRELQTGSGQVAEAGSTLDITYTVYRLSARTTPVYAWSLGSGQGGQDDVGEVYRFRLGDPRAVPAAVSAGLLGMREGGKRRVLVPPRLGWVEDGIGPPLPSFTAVRRLATHRKEPLLFEAELIKVTPLPPSATLDDTLNYELESEAAFLLDLTQRPGEPFKLPVPRSPYQNKLG